MAASTQSHPPERGRAFHVGLGVAIGVLIGVFLENMVAGIGIGIGLALGLAFSLRGGDRTDHRGRRLQRDAGPRRRL